ncbi:hypothetical protein FHS19_003517 [Paenibacillus rhizosphaerae]|uniref:Glycosyl hydrolase family 43 n=1 Tax=Paenibacillus rhizosphaerae TaxID=297318 RepID=A0A839TQ38_9BACL|nr:glycoside hydrolase family 43 protein [Paenibacillus rhizosphaerae]MBB3128842.1 hypothetical protein [Paenibacillus rhizosphaerae]
MTSREFHPGKPWLDTDGRLIEAHGGGILYHEGIYYWYGENKDAENSEAHKQSGIDRVDVIGVSCYSSKDLYHWNNEGTVLHANEEPGHDLHPSHVLERPKVLYNAWTKQFVMWMHVDHGDYQFARVGLAVSERPTGPFRYVRSFRPGGYDSRDMTVYQDDDGTAYLICSTNMNSKVVTFPLTGDYLDVQNASAEHFVMPNEHMSRESPAVFKYHQTYYMVTSGCTGWDANPAEYAVAPSVMGPWTVVGNPCIGEHADRTYYSQSTFVIPVAGKEHAFIFMADRWNRYHLRESAYVWLPVEFSQNGAITIQWRDVWDLSIFE